MPGADQTRWFLEEVQPHAPKVRAWLRASFPKLSDVDDVMQETYLRILRANSAAKLDHPKAYFFATARNAALDRFRRSRGFAFEHLADFADSPVLVDESDASLSISRDQELATLTAAIQALPDRCRQILILRKHHGLSHREIGERLGISPQTVNAQITIAMRKCREYFRSHGLIAEDLP